MTNALGQTTRITAHSGGGLPQTVIDPNGVTSTIAYDARQRLVSRTVQTGAGKLITSYAYDPAGNLIQTTLPDGSFLSSTFDSAHRPTRITDAVGAHVDYLLDALGNRTSATLSDATGTVTLMHTATFDALGRVLNDIGGGGQTTAYAWDNNDNAVAITDPLKHPAKRLIDPLNRIASVTDAAGAVTAIAYDAHDRPTSVTDANGGVTTYSYDGFGDVIQQVSPDSGKTIYRYDLGGNLIQRVDAAGMITNYAWDALDRIATTTYSGTLSSNLVVTPGGAATVRHLGNQPASALYESKCSFCLTAARLSWV